MERQLINIERKTFEFREEFEGNARVIRVTKRRKSFAVFIRFRWLYAQWICEILDRACRELDILTISRTTDDGSRVLIFIGGANKLGCFLSLSETTRYRKGHTMIFLEGSESFGWVDVAFTLHHYFGGVTSEVQGLCPEISSTVWFLPFTAQKGVDSMMIHTRVDAIKCDKDWVIQVDCVGSRDVEEVWARMLVCSRCSMGWNGQR